MAAFFCFSTLIGSGCISDEKSKQVRLVTMLSNRVYTYWLGWRGRRRYCHAPHDDRTWCFEEPLSCCQRKRKSGMSATKPLKCILCIFSVWESNCLKRHTYTYSRYGSLWLPIGPALGPGLLINYGFAEKPKAPPCPPPCIFSCLS